jgi:hypothetical protein
MWRIVLVSVICLRAACLAVAAPTILSVQVQQEGDNTPLPCRAWVEAGGERLFLATDQFCTPYARDRSFSCNGQFNIELPPGKAIVHIERGKEFAPIDKQLEVVEGRTTSLTIKLHRWIDMQKRGWYSADMHVHFINKELNVKKPDQISNVLRIYKQMALADDVNFVPLLSFWNENVESWPDWPGGPSVRADDVHIVTLGNEEIERISDRDGPAFESLGAPLFFGLSKPVYAPRKDDTYPCDAVLCRIARKTSPHCLIDNDKALWAENVVGVALGLIDSTQLCHNHYHREVTLRMGWGMIGAEPEEQKTVWSADQMRERTNQIYYRWLNCGFHLAATGGSAIGVMGVAMGQNRTYAKIDGPLSQESLLAAIKAGKTFATSGPMLVLTVNGHDVGDTLDFSPGNPPLVAKIELQSIQPIETLELIHNGQVINKSDVSATMFASSSTGYFKQIGFTPQRSGWVAARASFRRSDGTLHQAHTSPMYITVDHKPTAFKKDAEYMIRWIDRIMKVSEQPKRYSSEQDRAESQAVFREARSIYEKIARTAAEIWQD